MVKAPEEFRPGHGMPEDVVFYKSPEGRYYSPEKTSYSDHTDSIRAYNSLVQDFYRKLLWDELQGFNFSRIALATGGSDGRFEKGIPSLLEVILISSQEDLKPQARSLVRKKIGGMANRIGGISRRGEGSGLFSQTEIKLMDGETLLSAYRGDSAKLFPSRVLDQSFLLGSHKVFEREQKRFITEIQGKDGQRLTQVKRDRFGVTRSITRNGRQRFKGQELCHFDAGNGLAFYDEDDPNLVFSSVKQGHLRCVQNRLTLDFLLFCQEHSFEEGLNLLSALPTNTVERLFFLWARGYTQRPPSEIAELVDHYKFFLWFYHLCQWRYKVLGQKETPFDSNDFKARTQALLNLTRERIF